MTEMEQERIDCFWSKVDIKSPDECWLWTASVSSKGYGSFGISPKKTASAHKIAWALGKNNGILSEPKDHIMHSCDIKRCVNPNHLELGDAAQNNRDALDRGVRVNRRPSLDITCKRGHPRTPENTRADKTCIPCRKENDRKAFLKRDKLKQSEYHRQWRESKEDLTTELI